MSFLDEKKKSGKRPDYADVDKDGDREESMEKAFKDKEKAKNEEIGYGKDPETGEITPMSSDDAIKNWLEKIMSDLDNEEGSMEESKKTVELPADTTFTLDLKHLMKKHMNEGKSAKDTLTLTKALMKRLHGKGEVKVDGTKITFVKEADVPMDMPVDLPEPEVKKPRRKGPPRLVAFDTDQDSHFTGEDDYDYEGSMAKSELLKMKKYANALCDMIEDESQLESWLQAKITKAADYMSSVYHYLDYQRSKMDEASYTPDYSHLTTGPKRPSRDTINTDIKEYDPAEFVFYLANEDIQDFPPEEIGIELGIEDPSRKGRHLAKFPSYEAAKEWMQYHPIYDKNDKEIPRNMLFNYMGESKINEELTDREKAEFSVSKAVAGPLPDKYRSFMDVKKEFLSPIIYQDINDALESAAEGIKMHNDSTQAAEDFVEGLPINYMKLTYDKVDDLVAKAGGYDLLDLARKPDIEVIKNLSLLLIPFYKNTAG